MVVLAASICTKTGKAVLSRQFVEMTSSRIEGLLASFPKLANSGDQHTFVETETVRYVYQPLEQLYMVLITNKASNILQDIETLHLFARVVAEYCQTIDEKEVVKQAFDLLGLFDEIVSLGHRENVNMGSLRTIYAMESHEERIQAELEKAEEIKRKEREMDNKRREAKRNSQTSLHGLPNSYGGAFGSGLGTSGSFSTSTGGTFASGGSFSTAPKYPAQPANNFNSSGFGAPAPSYSAPAAAVPLVGKGLQLGKGNKQSSLLETIKHDEGIRDAPVHGRVSVGQASAPAHTSPIRDTNEKSIHVTIDEKFSATVNKDGGLQSCEVNGVMTLKVSDPAKARLRLSLAHNQDPSVQFKTHPNVDKNLWMTESVIGLKDPARPYPASQPLGILRWKQTLTSESLLPIVVNCWPSPTGNGTCDVNVEYELNAQNLVLDDVTIIIPYGSTPPTIVDAQGDYVVDKHKHAVVWTLPVVDASNSNGTLEFNVSGQDPGVFFPIRINFKSGDLMCGIRVQSANVIDGGSEDYSVDVSLAAETYQIV